MFILRRPGSVPQPVASCVVGVFSLLAFFAKLFCNGAAMTGASHYADSFWVC